MGATDDDLIRMLEKVQQQEDLIDQAAAPTPEIHGDPCPHCGEPAENTSTCHICETDGCLPPDLWTPGQPDNCLTLCVRCARTLHTGCAWDDGTGNPRCPTCKF